MWEQRTQRLRDKTIIHVYFFIVICSIWYFHFTCDLLYASDCNFFAAR